MRYFKFIFVIMIFVFKCSFAQSENNSESKQNIIPDLALISVTVGGDFIVTGSFSASPLQRVDHFINQIYIEAKQQALGITTEMQYSRKILKELEKYSLRNILLKRADGSEKRIDLERFRITGDFKDNPYLMHDDFILFPVIDLEKDFVAIDGAINKPRKIQYVNGDKLSDMILFAMGINEAFETVNKAEITRLSYDGKTEQIIEVDLSDDFELKRADRIRILGNEPQRKDFRVTLVGQVNNPGKVYITNENTTLREVIYKAGGLTNKAWIDRIELLRGESAELYLKKDEMTEIELDELTRKLRLKRYEMGRMSNLTIEDTLIFSIDTELQFFNELGKIDLSSLNDSSSLGGNFIVKDSDVIIIPEFENKVNVYGQVSNTGKYEFVNGQNFNYYIEKAGGYGDFAKDDEAVLIKGKGKKWVVISETENVNIEPGDYIWVPKEPQRTLEYYLYQASTIASVLGPIATIIVILLTK